MFPIIDTTTADKFKTRLYAAFKDAQYADTYTKFKAFVLEKTQASIASPNNETALALWQEFVAANTSPEVTVEEKVVEPVGSDDVFLPHNIVFNGTEIREIKRRLPDRVDRQGYVRWLKQQPVHEWLLSIKQAFESAEICQNPIPLDEPLYIRVNWLPAVTYEKNDNPSVRKDGVIVTFVTKEQKINGHKAKLLPNGQVGANATEDQVMYNDAFFYKPYVEERVAGVITDEQGAEQSVVYVSMVAGKEEKPNHRWSSCLIQSLDRKKTYFDWKPEKPQHHEPKERHHKTRTGFEGFQAQMSSGGISDIFSVVKHGQKVVCRFRIAAHHLTRDFMRSTANGLSHLDTYEQRNTSVDKTNNVWLDIRNPDGTWSVANSVLIGRGHFTGVNAVYDYKEYDAKVSRPKTYVKHQGKHILALMRTNTSTTERDILKACSGFQHADLRYVNDVLSYVKMIEVPVEGKQDEYTLVEEIHPIFKRYIKTHTVVSGLTRNTAVSHQFSDFNSLCKQAEKWLQKNVACWLVLEAPAQPKTYKKRKVEVYNMNRKIPFMAKQTCRWGGAVFADTDKSQPVTKEVVEELLKGVVLGVLGDLDSRMWFNLKTNLVRYLASQLNPDWDSYSDAQRRGYMQTLEPGIKVETPDNLFNPSSMGLQGSGDTPPSPVWFRLVERFYKAFNIDLRFTTV